MTTRTLGGVLVLFAVSGVGCEGLGQLQSDRLVMGTVLRSPTIELPGGGVAEEALTAATVFYGEKDGAIDDLLLIQPVGIPGAVAVLNILPQQGGVSMVTLEGQGDGFYLARSDTTPGLTYEISADYTLEVQDDQPDPYVVTVARAPAPEPPQGVPATHPVSTGLTVTRSGTDTAFLSVLRVDAGGAITETWTNRPEDVQGLLEIVSDPSPWQRVSFSIPDTAFPQTGFYSVVLTVVERGVPSADLFVASSVFVGAGEATTLQVQ